MHATQPGDGSSGRLAICIVGAGPRGLCVVERLCANTEAVSRDIVVHIVDPYLRRGSRVWATGQSPALLMNTIASQVTVFTDDTVDCAGPILPGPSLYEWARQLPDIDPTYRYPPDVLTEACAVDADTYPSRALYGHYLDWVLRRLAETSPDNVHIRQHQCLTVALAEQDDGSYILALSDGTALAGLDTVVLAQGHIDMAVGALETRLAEEAAVAGLRYVGPASPAEVDIHQVVRAGEPVIVRGMGLNFFDYMAMLTVGRGGRFERVDGRLAYRPSGNEPHIVAGSRRGVPYHARGENEKGVAGRHTPVFLTPDVIGELRARGRRGVPPRFIADVWPLIAREVELVYYTALVRQHSGEPMASDFAKRFTDAEPAAISAVLREYAIPDAQRWDWSLIEHPDQGRRFDSPAHFRKWLLDRLRSDVEQARGGNVTNPVKAALDVLRDIRNEVRLIVDHSGITGSSYRDEVKSWYTPLNAFLSIGPPLRRIEEMAALIEAGVLDVVGPGLRVSIGTDGFEAAADNVAQSTVTAQVLIEARLPDMDIRRTTDPLLSNLLSAGRCRSYHVPDPNGDGYASGGLDVTESPYRVVKADGTVHERLFAYGIPTETVHWVTAAGARPGVNSVMLSDADAIARAVLGITAAPTGH